MWSVYLNAAKFYSDYSTWIISLFLNAYNFFFFNYHSYKENCGFCLMMLESVVMDLVIFIFLLLPFLFFSSEGWLNYFPSSYAIFSVLFMCFVFT